jgi:hypothetical protein
MFSYRYRHARRQKGCKKTLGAQRIAAEIPQTPQGGEELERKAWFFCWMHGRAAILLRKIATSPREAAKKCAKPANMTEKK